MANLTGIVLGAAVVVLLEPSCAGPSTSMPAKASLVQLIVYGVALVVLMRVRPQGALPEGFSIWRRHHGKGERRRDARRDGRRRGSRPAGARVHQPGADRDRRRRSASARTDARSGSGTSAPVVLETSGRQQALRRHRRRRRPRHRAAQGHHHRARRPERRRQDHGVQPAHRVHPARPRVGAAERRRARRARTPTRWPAWVWSARSRTCASSTASPACRT